ncbi:lysophosphatidic acid receptor 6-like [Lampetra planeri]
MASSGNLNSSSGASAHPAFQDTLYVVIYSLLFPVGLAANALALWVFCRRLRPLKNGATVYMTCLATTDLLFVLSLPFRISYHAHRHWMFGEALCKLTSALFYANLYASVLFLTCICADRYLAIAHPLRFPGVRTPCVARLVALGVWVIVALGTIPIYLLDTTNAKLGFVKVTAAGAGAAETCFQGFSESDWETLSAVVLAVELVGFIVPLSIMALCSCGIVRALRRVRRDRRQFLHVHLGNAKAPRGGTAATATDRPTGHRDGDGDDDGGGEGDDDLSKVGRLVVSTLAIFVICFAPYHVEMVFYMLLRRQVLRGWARLEQVVRFVQPITLCLASSNCVLDPLIYYYRARAFRRALTLGAGPVCSGGGSRWRRWCHCRWPWSVEEEGQQCSSEPAVMMLRSDT